VALGESAECITVAAANNDGDDNDDDDDNEDVIRNTERPRISALCAALSGSYRSTGRIPDGRPGCQQIPVSWQSGVGGALPSRTSRRNGSHQSSRSLPKSHSKQRRLQQRTASAPQSYFVPCTVPIRALRARNAKSSRLRVHGSEQYSQRSTVRQVQIRMRRGTDLRGEIASRCTMEKATMYGINRAIRDAVSVKNLLGSYKRYPGTR